MLYWFFCFLHLVLTSFIIFPERSVVDKVLFSGLIIGVWILQPCIYLIDISYKVCCNTYH